MVTRRSVAGSRYFPDSARILRVHQVVESIELVVGGDIQTGSIRVE